MPDTRDTTSHVIAHEQDNESNSIRRRIDIAEPQALRTATRSLAVLEQSAGSYHWTPEGHKLADFSSGVLVANLGHNPTAWWNRVLEKLSLNGLAGESGEYIKSSPLSSYKAITPMEAAASEQLLASLTAQPGGQRMEKVLWAASGSEAVQKALWAAMKIQGDRDHIIATRGGFHGKKGLAGAVTGSEHDSERDPRVHFIGFPKEECNDLAARRRSLDLQRYQDEMESILREHGDRIGCLITEPYLGGGGSYHPQPEYLQWLEAVCREHDWLFILDEIQSNFGRTGPMYAFTHYGIEPDLVCLGKGLGNGAPVAAAVGRRDVLDVLSKGEGSDTYSANPFAMAAVSATLEEFEANDVLTHSAELAKVIEAGLEKLKHTGIVCRVRGEGCVWGIECQTVGQASPDEVAHQCVEACYVGDDQGLRVHLLGPLAGCVLRVSPPLTMPLDEAQEYLDTMFRVFTALAQRLEGES